MHTQLKIFNAPSRPSRDNQAVKAHATRAPALYIYGRRCMHVSMDERMWVRTVRQSSIIKPLMAEQRRHVSCVGYGNPCRPIQNVTGPRFRLYHSAKGVVVGANINKKITYEHMNT